MVENTSMEQKESEEFTGSGTNQDESGNLPATTDDTSKDQVSYMSQITNVPPALPPGWVVRSSRTQPGYNYYFHLDSGKCQWEMPVVAPSRAANHSLSQNKLGLDTDYLISASHSHTTNAASGSAGALTGANSNTQSTHQVSIKTDDAQKGATVSIGEGTAATTKPSTKPASAPSGILKRKSAYKDSIPTTNNPPTISSTPPSSMRSSKRSRGNSSKDHHHHPKEVRVLHLLKKHNGSRRPSSWRKKKITISKDEAILELQELMGILQEIPKDDFKELRATFEELAKTESDCSSSKRGGDLGFFGRSKYMVVL